MNKIIGVIAVVALIMGGVAFFGGNDGMDGRDGRDGVGVASGPTKYDTQYFIKGYTVGYDVTATSTAEGVSSITVTSQILNCDKPYISWTANIDQTITTQASTSAPFVNLRPGESCTILVYSATTTAATTMTWAAGTGIDLQEDEGETVIQNGLEIARLTFVKKANTDVIMWVEVGQVGD